jgi:phytoene desaturase
VLHFSTEGRWPDVPHHNILFGPRYAELVDEIYRGETLAQDPSLYLHHPTVTDPGLAPEGRSTFYALAPVPHLGRGTIDWEKEGPAYAERIIDILEQRMLPGLREQLGETFHFGPVEFESELNSHLGSAFSLEPILTQSAYFRVHNRDDVIRNLYFVGAGTHPGAGIPGVVGSAKATAGLMIADLAK